jgi:hypothetical protein
MKFEHEYVLAGGVYKRDDRREFSSEDFKDGQMIFKRGHDFFAICPVKGCSQPIYLAYVDAQCNRCHLTQIKMSGTRERFKFCMEWDDGFVLHGIKGWTNPQTGG